MTQPRSRPAEAGFGHFGPLDRRPADLYDPGMIWHAVGTVVLVLAVAALYARGGFAAFGRHPRIDLLVLMATAFALMALWAS